MATPVLNLLTNGLIEAEWLAQGEAAQPGDLEFARGKFNDILDEWAAQNRFVYNNEFNLYTLTPGLAPHTIGPTGTFVVPQRPVRLESAALVLVNAGNSSTDLPIGVEDDQWWAKVPIKDMQSSLPTNVYYSEGVPNGQLFFWPVPTVANKVRLQTWGLISQVGSVQQKLDLPPAYRKALTLTLAEELSGPRSESIGLTRKAALARVAISQNNLKPPRIETNGGGMPGSRSGARPDFNFLTGLRE